VFLCLRGPRHLDARSGEHGVDGRISAEAGAGVKPGTHVVLVLDGANWRHAQALAEPEDASLLLLPPHGPETDPTGQVIHFLKENRFANRVFEGVGDLTEAGRKARNWFVDAPGRIARMASRSRAVFSPCQI